MLPHGVRVIKIIIYRFHVRMWHVFRSSLQHEPLAQYQLSCLRPILPETFYYASGSIEGVGSRGNDQETVLFVLCIYIFQECTSSKRRAELREGRRDSCRKRKAGETPAGQEKRRRRAPQPETPPAESATESASI